MAKARIQYAILPLFVSSKRGHFFFSLLKTFVCSFVEVCYNKNMKLPNGFLEKMRNLLGDIEFGEFLKAYDRPRSHGLRINTLKINVGEFLKISPFELEPVPWTKDGFYFPEDANPGRHPYYYAGLYYIQEPSAMFPATLLEVKPGEYILDICAAPGGKTVQIAADMEGKGLLVANDVNTERVKALVKNIELCGARNTIVTNEPHEKLAERFPRYFDKILVDAPCSGEGMFRKDEEAAKSWEHYKCDRCAAMQMDILHSADRMLKPGGYIVYSTCTFSPEEDERLVAEFLHLHEGYELVNIPKSHGIESGRPAWSNEDRELEKTARLWPHKLKGEGHFAAVFKKSLQSDCFGREDRITKPISGFEGNSPQSSLSQPGGEYMQVFNAFEKENLNIKIEGHFYLKGNNLYCLPVPMPDFCGIKVAKFGWYLGKFTPKGFEPSHSLALSLRKNDIKNVVDFSPDSEEISRYLKGETLITEGPEGLRGICTSGYTLGWAKQQGGILKNLYPKGWRRLR